MQQLIKEGKLFESSWHNIVIYYDVVINIILFAFSFIFIRLLISVVTTTFCDIFSIIIIVRQATKINIYSDFIDLITLLSHPWWPNADSLYIHIVIIILIFIIIITMFIKLIRNWCMFSLNSRLCNNNDILFHDLIN